MNRIPIFYYHSIGGPEPETLALNKFILHLDALKAEAFQTITFTDLLTGNYNPGNKYAVLTFDDGLLDNYEHVFPLLVDYGFVGTFFVIPGFDTLTRWVHPKKRKWSNVVKPGYTIPFKNMQSHHRKELIEAGMEIGSHSFSHPKLSRIDTNLLFHEISYSKTYLENELGVPIETFCYPNGRYNSAVVNAVEEAGYLGATTTIPGYFNSQKSPFTVNRFLVENPLFFSEVLMGNGLSLSAYLRAQCRLSFGPAIRR